MKRLHVLASMLFGMATFAQAAFTTTNVTLPTGRGTQQFLYLKPDAPTANLVFMIGGVGLLSTDSFVYSQLSRNRERFAERGYAVAILDAPSDHQPSGMPEDFRVGSTHAGDIQAVMAYMRERANVPTWIMGNSNGTISAANVSINLPASPAFGTVLVSSRTVAPGSLLDMNLEALRRPTLVLHHRDDACLVTPAAGGPMVFSRLSGAPAKRYVEFSGGDPRDTGLCGGGPHVMLGLDNEFTAAVTEWIEANKELLQPANFQGLWYRAPAESESGWGVNIAHQGDIFFVTWFTYDTDGSGMWLVAPDVRRTTGNTYTGAIYRTTGPAFSSVPFNPALIGVTVVGTVTFTFTDGSNGTFAYTVNTVTQSKAITRQVFSTLPTCTAGGTQSAVLNFQDLWYAFPAESESGWGVNLTQQGDILFVTWFTYDAAGRGMWLVGPEVRRTTANTFSGALFRTTGPAFSAQPWNPSGVGVTQAGTATFTFTAANAGTFGYTVGTVTQSKAIVRQSFATPATVCRN